MKKQKIFWLSVVSGLAIGFVSGLFGGGGGMIAVPVLLFLFKLKTKQSHASSVLIILISSIVSAVTYSVNGFFDFYVVIYVGLGSIIGCALGAFILKKAKGKFIDVLFALVVLAAGLKLIIF